MCSQAVQFFSFFGPFCVKKRDACAGVKIPEDQYFVRHSVQSVRRRQPRHVQSHLNLPFFPRSEARFEPRRVVFSGSTCLNVLLHSAAAVRLANWIAWVGVWLNRCTKKEKSSIRIRLINASEGGSASTSDGWEIIRITCAQVKNGGCKKRLSNLALTPALGPKKPRQKWVNVIR